jgi:hypothetical protein
VPSSGRAALPRRRGVADHIRGDGHAGDGCGRVPLPRRYGATEDETHLSSPTQRTKLRSTATSWWRGAAGQRPCPRSWACRRASLAASGSVARPQRRGADLERSDQNDTQACRPSSDGDGD